MTGKDQIEQLSLISMVIKPVNRPIRWAVQLGFGAAALFGLILVKNFHLLETDQNLVDFLKIRMHWVAKI